MSAISSALRLSSKRAACRQIPATSSFALRSRSYADKKPDLYNVDEQAQGHANDPRNRHKRDPEAQSVKGGKEAHKKSDSPLDAASDKSQTTAKDFGKGNKEGVGFVDQVGSNSGTGKQFEDK